MDNIAGQKSSLGWLVHISVLALVALWLFPTLGLFVSSFRTVDQISTNGWWSALGKSEQSLTLRTAAPETQIEVDGVYVIEGNLFEDGSGEAEISSWGTSSQEIGAHQAGDTITTKDGETLTVQANGDYSLESAVPMEGSRGQRIFVTAEVPPEFTLDNYDTVLGEGVLLDLIKWISAAIVAGMAGYFVLRAILPQMTNIVSLVAGTAYASMCLAFFTFRSDLFVNMPVGASLLVVAMGVLAYGIVRLASKEQIKVLGYIIGITAFVVLAVDFGVGTGEGTVRGDENMGAAFMSTFIVTIPATIIPILIAAFAAYALAWMDFPGRALLVAFVVALLVVPLQLALIPLLKLHLAIGIGKGYLGIWLAHTGFGLPLAIYLLRNYMVGLPRDIIESARIDGATDFQIFVKLILPLSFPALASFAIFQFLWTWNDLLVAKVFLIDATGSTTVMTARIVELLGTRGGNWEILATSAFVSIAVPLVVFFAMQRFLVRGLLAGSVK